MAFGEHNKGTVGRRAGICIVQAREETEKQGYRIEQDSIGEKKVPNDLRLMSSGPNAGLGEITLPAGQNGSSVMPGKINPVIPEVVNQVAFNVIGNDVAITLAAEAGQLEMNVFEPIIFYNLFQSIDTLGFAIETFVDNCIIGITANEERCRKQVEKSVGAVMAG